MSDALRGMNKHRYLLHGLEINVPESIQKRYYPELKNQ
jgi:hypothetical protein